MAFYFASDLDFEDKLLLIQGGYFILELFLESEVCGVL